MPTQTSQQFKELKEVLEENKKKNKYSRRKNHDELIERVTRVEVSRKKALDISIKNEADIRKIELKQQLLKEEIIENSHTI